MYLRQDETPKGGLTMRIRGLGICAACWVVVFASCSRSLSVSKDKREADEMARRYWDAKIIKCGDTWLEQNLVEFFEWRQFYYTVVADQLTVFDKLGGFEWTGSTRMRTEAWRSYAQGRWQDWKSGTREEGMPIAKKNGRWEYGRGPFALDASKLPANELRCDQFPR